MRPLPPAVVLGLLGLILLGRGSPLVLPFSRVVVLLHELGHVGVGILSGAEVEAVRLGPGLTGWSIFVGDGSSAAWAGYPAALLGAGLLLLGAMLRPRMALLTLSAVVIVAEVLAEGPTLVFAAGWCLGMAMAAGFRPGVSVSLAGALGMLAAVDLLEDAWMPSAEVGAPWSAVLFSLLAGFAFILLALARHRTAGRRWGSAPEVEGSAGPTGGPELG